MNNEPKRPYYDPSVLARKREAKRTALEIAFKALMGFGKCTVVRASDAAMDAARQYKREQNKTT